MSDEEVIELRPEVLEFARVMEARLRVHDEKRGRYGWRGSTKGWLLGRLREEYDEFRAAIENGNVAHVLHEAADVANFAWFLWDVLAQAEKAHDLATPTAQSVKKPSGRLPVVEPPSSTLGTCLTCGQRIEIASFVRKTARSPDGRSHMASFCGSWCAQEYERRMGVVVS